MAQTTTTIPATVTEAGKFPRAASPSPKRTAAAGTVNAVTTAHCRVELPEHVYDQYVAQAAVVSRDPELLMAERLVRCAGQSESGGLYFSLAEKKQLELHLGHMVSDAAGALQRLAPLSKIDVSGVTITLDPQVMKRLDTRKRRGETLESLIQREVVKALKQYVGMLPY